MKTIKEILYNVLEWWLMMLPFLLLVLWLLSKVWFNSSCGGLALN